MHSRWFNATVVMLWLATMSWLVINKVLPTLLVGEPPSYASIVEAQRQSPPVGWRISLGGRRLGWALSETTSQPADLTDIHAWVHFDALPLKEIMPAWSHAFSQLSGPSIDRLPMDARSLLIIDPLGRLVRFDSSVRLASLNEVFGVRGTVEDRKLQLVVRTGGASFATETVLPSDALLRDVLSPQMDLPGLRAGQNWTVPVYSPLWPAKNPLEIIHAKVENLEPIVWNGHRETCWLVVYRSDAGSGAGGGSIPRGKLWVRRDGKVLRQQVVLFDSIIMFNRLPNDEAARLVERVGRQWRQTQNGGEGETHD